MKEKDKYYTPQAKEFRIGFEYEYEDIIESGASDFFKGKIEKISQIQELLNNMYVHGNMVRVKYLDKEDVESLGFAKRQVTNCFRDDEIEEGYVFPLTSKNEAVLHFIEKQTVGISEHSIYDEFTENWFSQDLFFGKIKNKSELKKLMEQLNIKSEDNE